MIDPFTPRMPVNPDGDESDELRPADEETLQRLAYSGHIPDLCWAVCWNATLNTWRLRLDDRTRRVITYLSESDANDPAVVDETWGKLERALCGRRTLYRDRTATPITPPPTPNSNPRPLEPSSPRPLEPSSPRPLEPQTVRAWPLRLFLGWWARQQPPR